MAVAHPFYLIWSGSLNLGDTPGVFADAHFAGLLLQLPLTVSFLPEGSGALEMMLTTTEVEIFSGKKHPVYWDWTPGDALPVPCGFIDDEEAAPGMPELHRLIVPRAAAGVGRHWLTIHVNAAVDAGMRDDFVLKRIEAHETAGVKIGW